MQLSTTRARILLGVCASLVATATLLAVRTGGAQAADARAAAAEPARAVAPDAFDLRGWGVAVNFATTSLDGRARLTYTAGGQTLHFAGEQISVTDAPLGTLVTVQLAAVPDASVTTFTLVIPHIAVEPGQVVPVRTQGITTTGLTSIAPELLRGQLQTYRVTPLFGTAQFVYF